MSKPAQRWHDSLPVGNGRLGVLTYGRTDSEEIVINEETVWSARREKRINPKGPEYLKEVRRLLFAGEQAKAENLCTRKFMTHGPNKASYQPVGMLHLKYTGTQGPCTDYRRGILLSKGISYVTFKRGGTTFRQETFVPYDREVIVHTLKSDKPGALSLSISADRPNNSAKTALIGPSTLHLSGTTGKRGVAFNMLADFKIRGGKVEKAGNTLKVVGADQLTLFIAVATDYNMADPLKPLTRNRIDACRRNLQEAEARGAERLRIEQAKRFSSIFNRVALELPGGTESYPSIETLLAQSRKEKKFSTDLLLLYYDFCRYTLISSSRPGGFPATLLGIWNPLLAPPWSSDWHTNINISMFYWPAATWDLAEHAKPLISLIRMGLNASHDVAREMLGVKEGGFLLNSTDAWGATTPVRIPCFGMYVVGAAWLLQDAIAPWYATRDPELIREILPLLRDQTQFFLGWLVRHPKTGKWVSGPSASPENTYIAKWVAESNDSSKNTYIGKGGRAAVDMGCTHDQILVYLTLRDFIRFAKELTPDDVLIARAESVIKDLAKPKIAPDGSLQEWSLPFRESEARHRHLSHTYGMMPGRIYSLHRTPKYAEAIRKSLEKRIKAGYHGMGWSFGWMSCLQIRLNDPEKALRTLDGASQYLCGNLFTSCCGCPQVADMNGVPSAVNEMLVRNEEDFIEILPALAKRYSSKGSFRGFCADKGFVISAAWKEGKVTSLSVTSRLGGPCTLRYNGGEKRVETRKGETVTLL